MMTAPPHCVALELRDVPVSDPWDTIKRGSRLISRRVGLIRHYAEGRHQAQDPAVFTGGVLMSDLSRCLPNTQALTAGGAGDTAAAALASGIGEAVERYCACIFDSADMVYGTSRELGDDAVPAEKLRLFSREQCERFGPRGPAYFDAHSRVRWVWGYSLTEQRPRLVPASFVYLNYRPGKDEDSVGVSASTGGAAGATREEAILSGLLEVIERDAFTLAWMQRRAGRRIEIDDEEIASRVKTRLWGDRPSVDVKFFDLTTDLGIPVVLLIMRRPTEFGPLACLGAASRLSPRQAVRKAMQESGQNFPLVRNLLIREKDWQPVADFSNLTTFDYHFLTYVRRPDLVSQAFAFFEACEDRVPLSQLRDRSTGRVLGDIEEAVACLRAAGHEVIVTDITTPDIAEIGLSVVRVIVPGLVPLNGHHLRPCLGVRRLADRSGEMNPFPHPFP